MKKTDFSQLFFLSITDQPGTQDPNNDTMVSSLDCRFVLYIISFFGTEEASNLEMSLCTDNTHTQRKAYSLQTKDEEKGNHAGQRAFR